MNRILSGAAITLLASLATTAWAAAPLVCIALPKAQLGQGNNSPTDVSEPVRTALGKYLAGPSVQLVSLDARIPIQIEAEATQKSCNYVLQTSVTQQKKRSSGGFFKALAPIAGALPMLGGMGGGGMGGMSGMVAGQVASSMATASATASVENMQQDYMAMMTGAQQSNVKAGDTLTVAYQLSAVGNVGAGKPLAFEAKAKQDGEDVIDPLLEQVATAVLTAVTAT